MQLSGEKSLSSSNDPLTEQLQKLINSNAREPDHLSQATADILFLLDNSGTNSALTKLPQDLIERIEAVTPEILQPALILKKGQLLKAQDPTIVIERPLIDLIQELQKIMALLTEKQSNLLVSYFSKILKIYQSALQQWQNASELDRRQLLIPKPQLVSTNLEFFYLDIKTALTILCRDAHNYTIKTIAEGIHPVVCLKGTTFVKPNPFGKDGICPGMEYLVYSFYKTLTQALVVAPTTMNKVLNVYVEEIIKERQDPATYEEFNKKLTTGHCAEAIVKDPTLANRLVKTPALIERTFQGGQAITGIGLDKLHLLVEEYDWLKTIFPNFSADLTSLLNEDYVSDFTRSHPEVNNISKENLFKFLIAMMKTKAAVERFEDFSDPDSEKNLHIFNKVCLKYSNAHIIKALAFISKWPNAANKRHLGEILNLIKVFELLPTLYPKSSIADIERELPHLLEKIDDYNFSAHYVGGLLTWPTDGKGDNYIVAIHRDAQGKIIRLEVVGIDNDKNLGHPVIRVRDKCYAGSKSIIFTLPKRRQPVNKRFRQDFLSKTAETFMFQWLRLLYLQDQRHHRLVHLGILTENDQFDASNGTAMLDIPLRIEPSMLITIYKTHQKIYSLLESDSEITHEAIFEAIEPQLCRYYRQVVENKKYPLAAMHEIYSGASIQATLRDPAATVALESRNDKESDYEVNRIQTVEEAIQLQFIDKALDYSNISPDDLATRLKNIVLNFPFCSHLPLNQTELNNWLRYGIKNRLADFVKMLLRAGADVNHADPENNRPLHRAITISNPSFSVLTALLEAENININLFNKDGIPAIFCCYDHIKMIKLFLASGADIDIRADIVMRDGKIIRADSNSHPEEKLTLLDYAIANQASPTLIAELIQLGVGKKANAKITYEYLKKHLQDAKHSAIMQEALAKLSSQNPSVAWLAGLDVTFEEDDKKQLVAYRVVGMTAGPRVIRPEVLEQIFDKKTGKIIRGNEKNPQKYGRHPVPDINHKGRRTRVKFEPEAPLVETGTRMLSMALWGEPLGPHNEIFKFPPATPVLASNHIEGINLQEIFDDPQKYREQYLILQNKLNMKYFTMLFILVLLLNSADDKADQFILVEFINSKGEKDYKLMCVDNEQKLVPPAKKVKDKIVLLVKCLVFCLNQMTAQDLDEEARDIFLKHDFRKLLENWILGLEDQQKIIDELFPLKDRKRLFGSDDDPGVLLRFPFAKGTAASIYEKAISIQDIWRANPKITGLSMLKLVIPIVGIFYADIHEKCKTPDGRFKILHGDEYNTIENKAAKTYRFVTKVTSKQLLQTQNIPEEAMVAAESDYTPAAARGELRIVDDEKKKLEIVRSQLVQDPPNTTAFQNLLLDSSKEAIIKKLKFGEIPANRHLTILALFDKISFRELTIPNSEITDTLLTLILKNSPNLQELDISNCRNLTPSILPILSQHCPLLKRLYMNSWVQLKSLKNADNTPIWFKNLENLQLNDCTNLETISINAIRLQGIWLDNCNSLATIDIDSHQLEKISHKGFSRLSSEQLERIVSQSPALLKNPSQVSSTLQLKSQSLTRCIGDHQNQTLWTDESLNLLCKGAVLDLTGLQLPYEATQKIITHFARKKQPISEIKLQGCTASYYDVLLPTITAVPTVEKVHLTQHQSSATFTQIMPPNNLNTFVVDSRGKIYIAGFDKTFSQWQLKSTQIDTADKTPTNQRIFAGHENSVSAFVVLPNRDIVTGSNDSTIKVWNCFTRDCLRTFKVEGSVTALAATDHLLISAENDSRNKHTTIRHWNIQTGERLKVIDVKPEVINTIEIVSSDCYVTGSDKKKLSIWNFSGKRLKTIQTEAAISAAKKVSRNLLATAHSDNKIRVWNTQNWVLINTLEGHQGPVEALQAIHQDTLFASGSLDRTIIIWDLITGEKVRVLSGHGKGVNFLALTPDGDLISAGLDGGIFLWRFNNWLLDLRLLLEAKQEVKVTVTDNSISVQAEPTMLVLCQQLLYHCIGPSRAKVSFTNTDLHIEVLAQEKYQRITDLFAALNKRIHANMPINWKSQKPAAQIEGAPLSRNSASGSGRSGFFGEARSSNPKINLLALPQAPLPVPSTTTTTSSAPLRGLQIGSPERRAQVAESSSPSSGRSLNLQSHTRPVPPSPLAKQTDKEEIAPAVKSGK
jgi:WD40 repeat protein